MPALHGRKLGRDMVEQVPFTCPLCGGEQVTTTKHVSMQEIVGAWQSDLRLDIRQYVNGISEIQMLRCASCRLEFFAPPSLVGSPELYEQLEKLDLYYLPRKWEHDVALRELDGCHRGLEIGCGFGDFVERALLVCPAFEGCEQNLSAIRVAQSRGLPVNHLSLEELSASRARQYDAVCSFQVLEHVANPARFLQDCATLLRPGGKLMLGLPNGDSFLKYQFNVLDMPPHHMTRWTSDVLRNVPKLFPFALDRIEFEPLPEYQVDAYVNAYSSAAVARGARPLTSTRIRRHIQRVVRRSSLRRFLKGQTLHALFTRL